MLTILFIYLAFVLLSMFCCANVDTKAKDSDKVLYFYLSFVPILNAFLIFSVFLQTLSRILPRFNGFAISVINLFVIRRK